MATTAAPPRHLHVPTARRWQDAFTGGKGVHRSLLSAPGARRPRVEYVGLHREELG